MAPTAKVKIGDKFGLLTVISELESRSGKRIYNCQCECGNITDVISTNLTGAKTRSCGCIRGWKPITIGQKFGRLTVLSELPANGKRKTYKCGCECGNYTETQAGNLNSGKSTSCGCYRLEQTSKAKLTHGRSRSRGRDSTYSTWAAMRDRCLNKNNAKYPRWGGRGITICERWNSFENFVADMGNRPTGMTIERIHNDKGYSKDNCCWATPKEQAGNRRAPQRRRRS